GRYRLLQEGSERLHVLAGVQFPDAAVEEPVFGLMDVGPGFGEADVEDIENRRLVAVVEEEMRGVEDAVVELADHANPAAGVEAQPGGAAPRELARVGQAQDGRRGHETPRLLLARSASKCPSKGP